MRLALFIVFRNRWDATVGSRRAVKSASTTIQWSVK